MSNGIQRVMATEVDRPRYTFTDLSQMADAAHQSGLFGKMNKQQIVVLMMLCDSEGIPPIRALMMYDIIDGKPSVKPAEAIGRFQNAGGSVEWTAMNETVCTAVFTHPKACPRGVEVSFSMEDAKRAQLAHKDNWKKYPVDCMCARVSIRGVKRALPGVLTGLYDPDDHEPIDVTPAEQAAHSALSAKLKANRGDKHEHQPVAEVVAELKAAEARADGNGDHPEPKSEFRSWVDEQLSGVNAELNAIAEAQPDNVGARVRITPYQVANHLINEGIDAGRINETAILGANGKRDKQACSAVVMGLWEDDSGWCMDVVGKYLAGKVVEAQKAPEPAVQQALLA